MKKILLFMLLIAPVLTNAKIWRVNNSGGIQADFTNLQTASDSALASDTIMMEGSANNYGNATINKKLYIFGPGFFLAQNPMTQANPSTAQCSTLTFATGSAGSLLCGMEITTFLNISDDNIIIKRNLIRNQGITVYGKTNIMIIQNYIACTYNGTSYSPVYLKTGCSNIFISNNYASTYSIGYTCLTMDNTSSATITQNVFGTGLNIQNSICDNNIVLGGTNTLVNTNAKNNLCAGSQFDTTNGNQQNIVMTDVFVGLTGNSTDGQWKLKAGSPAIGAGANAEDCGMFGGNDPYVLSGMPPLPSIFFFSAPSSGSAAQGLPVKIKIKSNK